MTAKTLDLLFELLIMLLQDRIATLQREIVHFDLLKNRAGVEVLTQFLHIYWTIKQLGQVWYDLVNDPFSGAIRLLHRIILLLDLVKLSLVVSDLISLLAFFRGNLVLGEQPLGLVEDEVAEDLESVLLLYFLPLKE